MCIFVIDVFSIPVNALMQSSAPDGNMNQTVKIRDLETHYTP